MHIERKFAVAAFLLLAVTAAFAVAQVGPARKGSDNQIAAAGGAFDSLEHTPMQQCLMDLITWEQMLAHDKLGGSTVNWHTFSDQIKDARMEVVRACNLYHRATLTPPQQKNYDATILDPKGHPLPPKWEKMRLKGTLVKSLLQSTAAQQQEAQKVLDTFRDRNHAIWGTKEGMNGGYRRNHDLLVKEFRAILNKEQLAEFDNLWHAYLREVAAAVKAGLEKP